MEEDIYRLNPRLLSFPPSHVRNGNVINVSSSSAAAATCDELHLGLMANNNNNNNNYLHMIQEYPEPPDVAREDPVMKNQIATHPLYPNLLSAFIECQKVGAPTELASLLEEIGRESHPTDALREIGDDPDLDEFMESYCEVLHRYKEELSKPLNEATLFLCNMESQLSDLCKGTLTMSSSDHNSRSDEAGGTSEDELSCGKQVDEGGHEPCGSSMCPGDQELKETLLRKYGGYLSSLKKEFLKKRKKGKLPKDARKTLMDWWSLHYRWPYPSEEEKLQLSEMSGLDIKQINNWFINQRKRHWKPSEDMRFAIMEGVTSNGMARPM